MGNTRIILMNIKIRMKKTGKTKPLTVEKDKQIRRIILILIHEKDNRYRT